MKLKLLVVFIFCGIVSQTFGQKLFRVGGSGNFLDPAFWATDSLGQNTGYNVTPESELVITSFSQTSGDLTLQIHANSSVKIKKLIIQDTPFKVLISGQNAYFNISQYARISINTELQGSFNFLMKGSVVKFESFNVKNQFNLGFDASSATVNSASYHPIVQLNTTQVGYMGVLRYGQILQNNSAALTHLNPPPVNTLSTQSSLPESGVIDSLKLTPTLQTLCPNSTATVTATAFGTGPFATPFVYSLYVNGVLIQSQTTSSTTVNFNFPASNAPIFVSVEDANNNLVFSNGATVLSPIILVNTTTTQALCFAQCSGTATFTNYPNALYSVDGGPFLTGNSRTGLCPGPHTVTVQTQDGCVAGPFNFNIGQRPQIVTSVVSSIQNACFGQSNASITVNAVGGTGTKTFSWNTTPVQTGATASNLQAGSYIVTTTDANNCVRSDTFGVVDPLLLTSSIASQTNVSCFGGNNGQVTLNVSGGTNPVSVTWSTTPVQTGITASNLTQGNYTATVTDFNNCQVTTNVTITQPTLLTASITGSINPTCFGLANGEADAAAAGGIPPYSFSWSGGQSGASVTGLASGVNTVTVTDALNCTAQASVNLVSPNDITISLNGQQNVTCNGLSNGSASVSVSGGNGGYSYLWTPSAQTNDTAFNLPAQSYSVLVTDVLGCSNTLTGITITQPDVLVATATVNQNVDCNGNATGAATVAGTGGTLPYNFSWNTSPVQNTATASNLPIGTYTGTITDANGCADSDQITITQPPVLTANFVVVNTVSCNGGSDGRATATISGGTPPYTRNWTTVPVQSGDTAINLTAGPYSVVITDANGCTVNAAGVISQPSVLSVSIPSFTNPTCTGLSNGQAQASASGGTSPYTFAWSGGQTGNNPNTLSAGLNTVTVTDSRGCAAQANVTLTAPTPVAITVGTIQNVTCFGLSNGSIPVTASGGNGGYTYLWTPTNQAGATANNLPAGTYSVLVTDALGCQATQSNISVSQPALLSSTATVLQNVSCNTGSNGAAVASGSGGTTPYSFSWNTTPVQTLNTATGLQAGTYTVTISDANGCQSTSQATITQPLVISTTVTITNTVSCNGGNDGAASISVSGGTSPYTIIWNTTPVQTGTTASNLPAGITAISITDANLCTSSSSVNMTQPSVLTAQIISTTNPSCNGLSNGQAQAAASGGTAPYTFTWSGGQTGSNPNTLATGLNTVTVTDSRGCTAQASTTLTAPSPVSITVGTIQNVTCFGLSNGSIPVTASGGNGGYTYLWTPSNQTGATANNLPAATYSVLVTDALGCQATQSNITVTQPALLTATATTLQNTSCNGGNNGAAIAAGNGGTSPYTFTWNTTPAQNNATAIGLLAGTYTATVTDANGCQSSSQATISQPNAINIQFNNINNITCNGLSNGSVSAAVTGGTAPFSYSWNTTPLTTDSFLVNRPAGTYTLNIVDANNCAASNQVTLTQPSILNITIQTITNASCGGAADGSASVSANGGTAPYSFLWSNGNTGATATGLIAGTYSITVIDANGCTANTNVTINQPTPIVISLTSINNIVCGGTNSGSITVSATGAGTNFTYVWNTTPVQNGPTANNLPAGPVSVTVTDLSNNCTAVLDTVITQTLPIQANISSTNVSCFGGNNGSVTVSVNQGTAPYSITWNTTPPQTGFTLNNLNAGTYIFTVTDANNCQTTDTAFITQPTALSVGFNNIVNPTCAGNLNGGATAAPVGGTAPYTYLWSNGQTTQTLTSVQAGSYTVFVNDANGCAASNTINLVDPAGVLVVETITNPPCFGDSIGSISLSVSGGVAPYTFFWNNGNTTNSINNVVVGTYGVTVSDQSGCIVSRTFNLAAPSPIQITNSSTNLTCANLNDGTATSVAIGGTPPYTFTWSNGSTGSSITNLAPGIYCVSVTDVNGCIAQSFSGSGNFPGGSLFLPDGTGTEYQTSININSYPAGQVVTSGNDIASICINIEHTWLGDLTMRLRCPTGNVVFLKGTPTGPNGGGGINLGVPFAGNSTGAGIGFNYCFSNTPSFGTMIQTAQTPSLLVPAFPIGQAANNPDTLSLPAGTYQIQNFPGNSFNNLIGCPLNGNWILEIRDEFAIDNGWIFGWNIEFAPAVSLDSCVTITAPPALVSTTTGRNASCAGANDGQAIVDVSGGVSPYTFSWNTTPAQTNDTITGLSAGTYIVTITDVNGCVKLDSVTITQPVALVSSIASQTQVSCNGGNNGSATISVSGGSSPYNIVWNTVPAQSGLTVSNLTAGTYNAVITDANNCQINQPLTILQNSSITINTVAQNNPSCLNTNNGSIQISVANGQAPYSISWNTTPAQTGLSASNLPAGNYTVTVVDNLGCIATQNFTLAPPNPLITSISSQNNVLCFGGNNGSATATASGGSAPYIFVWNTVPVQNSATASNLIAGTYTVTVTDNNGCTSQSTANITQPSSDLSVVASVQNNVLCFGAATGAAIAAPAGGTAPYNVVWNSVPVQTGLTATNLVAGNYKAFVSDANGCIDSSNVTIIQPTEIAVVYSNITQPGCGVICTGQATANAIGGTGPYTYSWGTTPAQNSQSATSLCAGNTPLTVADANGCIFNTQITLNTLVDIVTNANESDISCFGLNNGAISLNPSGGQPPYTITWSNGAGNVSNISGLSPGTYSATITDQGGCVLNQSFTITQPLSLAGTAGAIDTECNPSCNGIVFASASGGTAPYQFTWNTTPPVVSDTLFNVCAGSYNVTIQDANGCTAGTVTFVNEPLPLTISLVTSTNSACAAATGSALVAVSGGTAPYTINWSGGQTGLTANNLASGSYTVTVTDASGCTNSLIVGISDISGPSVTNLTQSNVTCPAGDNGTFSFNISGIATIQTSFNGGSFVPFTGLTYSQSNLDSGQYSIVIRDGNNCITTQVINITQPQAFDLGSLVTNATCNGLNNGSVILNPTGGTGPYSFVWQDGPTTQNRTNLPGGNYVVTLTDNANCLFTDTIIVLENQIFTANVSATNVSCVTQSSGSACDGSAVLALVGGTAPFSINWSGNPTNTTLFNTGLCAGSGSVSVTDAGGCIASANYTINAPATLSINTVAIQNDACPGTPCNGLITVAGVGGSGTYNFNWTAGPNTPTFNNLCVGAYEVTVRDAANFACAEVQTFNITEPAAMVLSANTTNVNCFGGISGAIDLTVTNGTAPLSYSWNNGSNTQDLSNITAGNYTVTVTDNSGCTAQGTYSILQNPEISITGVVTDVLCGGQLTGAIQVNLSGGTVPYTFSWSNGSSGQNLSNIVGGIYVLNVIDANGCTSNRSFTVNETAPLTAVVATQQDAVCGGGCTGAISVNVTGGNLPYTYAWSNGGSSASLTNLCPGPLQLIVTDANNCSTTLNSAINTNSNININVTSNNLTCNGICNGSAIVTANGGSGTLSYSWSNGVNTQINNNLCAGNYVITVTDTAGCVGSQNVNITEPSPINVVMTQNNVTCFGLCDGSATANAAGGTGLLNYLWNDGNLQTTATASNLCPGSYSVTVSDQSGCSTTQIVSLSQPTPLSLTSSITEPNCNQNNGVIQAMATGGTAPYSYLWAGGQTTSTITNLVAGTYSIIVTDANACTQNFDIGLSDLGGPAITATQSAPTCNGLTNGSINITINSGVAPYTYTLNGGPVVTIPGNTIALNNLSGGSYSFSITGANTCVTNTVINLIEPLPLQFNPNINNQTCSGLNDGSIVLNVTGGTAPYTYAWNTGATSASLISLNAGNYNVTVTDANNCTLNQGFTISTNNLLVANLTTGNVSCNNGITCDGLASVNPIGGTAPYTINWSSGATGNAIINLCAGSYNFSIADASGCTVNQNFTIGQPLPLTIDTLILQNPFCVNDCNGQISVDGQGGSFAYLYQWNTGSTNNSISNLCAGNYQLTLTDASNTACSANFNLNISNPQPFTVQLNTVDETCVNSCNGTASVTVSGGLAPYNISWSTGAVNVSSIASLCAGNYSITITDLNGCDTTIAFVIQTGASFTVADNVQNVLCNGGNNGSISLFPQGTGPFFYTWNTGANTSTINNLSPGNYTVTVFNSVGCLLPLNYTISEPAAIQILGISNPSICNGSTGIINTNPIGGTAPYSFNWSSGQTSQNLNNVPSGIYTLNLTDQNGCIASRIFTVSDLGSPQFAQVINPPSCSNVCDGSAVITNIIGIGPFSFLWSPSGATTQGINNVCPDTVIVSVTDANGCTRNRIYDMTGPDSISVNAVVNDIACGAPPCSGSIALNLTGGTAPYSVSWVPGNLSGASISNLCQGAYTATISDANNCVTTSTFNINQISPFTTTQNLTPVSCSGLNNGAADFTFTGGVAPYIVTGLQGTQVTNSVVTYTSLAAGNYNITVTDQSGCAPQVINFTISQGNPILANASSTLPTCNNSNNGSITISPSGGSAPYSILWGGGQTSTTISSLSAGTYTVTITDNIGCTEIVNIVLPAPAAIQANLAVVTPVSCAGFNIGELSASPTGGTAPYLYQWGPGTLTGGTTSTIQNLSPGSYFVDITDANGCSATDTIQLFAPVIITANQTVINPDCGVCNGAITLAPAGGSGSGYTASWTSGASGLALTNLCAGTYIVNITDGSGCTNQVQIILNSTNAPVLTFNSSTLNCFGDQNAGIKVIATGGTAPYQYSWNPIASNQDSIFNLGSGIFSVTVTDALGCSSISSDTILSPNQITPQFTNVNATCGVCDGSSSVIVSGGTAPYTYMWSNGSTGSQITNACTGVYSLQVVDANGCSSQFNTGATISSNSGPNILGFTVSDVSCVNTNDGSVTVNVSGAVPPYQYAWLQIPGETSNTAQNLPAGTYTVTVTDANGCQTSANATVGGPINIPVTANIVNPDCGVNNGSISLFPIQGNPYSYTWSNGLPSGDTQNGLSAGVYSAYYTLAPGCIDSITVILSNPTSNPISISSTNVDCFGNCNGSATVNVVGAPAGYLYLWSNGQTAPNITGLCAGTYYVSVQEILTGCVRIDTLTINEPNELLISGISTTSTTCGSTIDGTATVNIIGGTLPYSYQWNTNPAQNSNTATGLASGIYQVNVVDNSGCSISTIANVSTGIPFYFQAALTNAQCGVCDGVATINISGGSGNFNYLWFNGETQNTVDSLCPGIYQISVTDNANGCFRDTLISISGAGTLALNTTVYDATCSNTATGAIKLNITGGTAPYTIQWPTLTSSSDSVFNLLPGTYPVLVTDAAGCVITDIINLSGGDAVQANALVINPECGLANGSIVLNPTGGSTPYTYQWNTGATGNVLSNLQSGTYQVVITQATGCTDTLIYNLSNSVNFVVSANITNAACFTSCNGAINLTPTGGSGTFNFLWSNGSTDANVTDLCPGDYTVSVTDLTTGCTYNKTYTIASPPQLVAQDFLIQSPSCGAGCNGSANVVVFGGVTPYSILWSNGETTFTATQLCAGNIDATITDGNGCTTTVNFILSDANSVTASIVNITQPNCTGAALGSVEVTATGGVAPYNYTWIQGISAIGPIISNLTAGTYVVVASDLFGCTDTLEVVIDNLNPIVVFAGNDTSFCGIPDLYTLIGLGNNSGIDYTWINQNTGIIAGNNDTVVVTGLVDGDNFFILQGALGTCNAADTVRITSKSIPFADAGSDVSIKIGDQVTIGGNPTAQSGNATIWTPDQNINNVLLANPTVSPTATTWYIVEVSGSNGCIGIDSAKVEVLPIIEFVNGFTPNGDGINDFWIIDNIDLYPEALVQIYSRWGEQIYSSVGYKTPWNGTYKGSILPVGTYYYIIDLKVSGLAPFTGAITIMR